LADFTPFVKTLKGDYGLVATGRVPELIAGWFEGFNNSHPQSRLKICSPHKFVADQTTTA